jgi:hypothetical protein
MGLGIGAPSRPRAKQDYAQPANADEERSEKADDP